jgi:hypothetical protein
MDQAPLRSEEFNRTHEASGIGLALRGVES